MTLFVCDLCNIVDSVELAYPSKDFTKGPPKPWRCTQCQGHPWHDVFPRTPYQKNNDYIPEGDIVNRVSENTPHIGLG